MIFDLFSISVERCDGTGYGETSIDGTSYNEIQCDEVWRDEETTNSYELVFHFILKNKLGDFTHGLELQKKRKVERFLHE